MTQQRYHVFQIRTRNKKYDCKMKFKLGAEQIHKKVDNALVQMGYMAWCEKKDLDPIYRCDYLGDEVGEVHE